MGAVPGRSTRSLGVMESESPASRPTRLSIALPAIGAVAALCVVLIVSVEVIQVFVDPRTVGQRWMLTWDKMKTLPVFVLLFPMFSYVAWARYRRRVKGE